MIKCRLLNWFGLSKNHRDLTHDTKELGPVSQRRITSETLQAWELETQTEDKVVEMVDKNGVHFRPRGRIGRFYIVKDGKVAFVEFELGANSLLLYFESVSDWEIPFRQPLSPEDKAFCKEQIITWATLKKTAVEFDD